MSTAHLYWEGQTEGMTKYKAEQLNRVVGYLFDNPGSGRSAVAKELGVKVTPYLINDIVGRLITEGWVRAELDQTSPAKPVWKYYLTDSAIRSMGAA